MAAQPAQRYRRYFRSGHVTARQPIPARPGSLLVLDGAYVLNTVPLVFQRIEPPRREELQALTERIAEQIGRALGDGGLLEREPEESHPQPTTRSGGPWTICWVARSRTV